MNPLEQIVRTCYDIHQQTFGQSNTYFLADDERESLLKSWEKAVLFVISNQDSSIEDLYNLWCSKKSTLKESCDLYPHGTILPIGYPFSRWEKLTSIQQLRFSLFVAAVRSFSWPVDLSQRKKDLVQDYSHRLERMNKTEIPREKDNDFFFFHSPLLNPYWRNEWTRSLSSFKKAVKNSHSR